MPEPSGLNALPFFLFRRVTDNEWFSVGQGPGGLCPPPPPQRRGTQEPHAGGGGGAKRQRGQPDTKPKYAKKTKE